MIIRPAKAEEAEALSALALKAKSHWGYAPEQMDKWRDELAITPEHIRAKPTFVAVEGREIVGFHSLKPSPGSWELDNLWVVPGSMRQGVGRALLFHALDHAASNGAHKITVDSDPYAAPFYIKCGARQAGAVPAPIPGQPERVRPQLVFEKRESSPLTGILDRFSYAVGLGSAAFIVMALPVLFWPHELGKYMNGYSYLATLVVAYFCVPYARRYLPRFR